MSTTLDEARKIAMQLTDDERASLSEELAASVFEPGVLGAWLEESERRLARMQSGEDPGLTLEQFWSDDEP
jgi:hypothetical protein